MATPVALAHDRASRQVLDRLSSRSTDTLVAERLERLSVTDRVDRGRGCPCALVPSAQTFPAGSF